MDLSCLPALQDTSQYHCQEWESYLSLYLHCVCILLQVTECHTNITFYSHPSITISRARHDESTSNLTRHVRNCAPNDSTQTRALAVYASGSKYTKASHHMKLALWVSNRHRLFSIVEDPELLEIFTDLNPNCSTPKHHTLSRDVKEIFSLSKIEVGTKLQVSRVISFSTISAYFTFSHSPVEVPWKPSCRR